MRLLKIFSALVVSMIIPLASSACGGWDVQWHCQDLFLLEAPLYADNAYETYKDAALDESVDFWYNYCNRALDKETIKSGIRYYDMSDITGDETSNKFIRHLRKKNDRQALNFLLINDMLQNKCLSSETWDYDKEVDNMGYEDILNQISQLPTTGKLAQRVAFMKFRCLFAMKRYNECITFFNNKKEEMKGNKKLYDRMYGYVGGVYLKQKKYEQALEVFNSLGDNLSVHKCIDALMSKGGLDMLKNKDVNSLTLRYVAQNYANYFYHYKRYLEMTRGYGDELELEKDGLWYRVIQDYDYALSTAKEIAENPRTENKMFWYAFIGFMQWVNDKSELAYQNICKAENAKGEERMLSAVHSYKLLTALTMRIKPDNINELFLTEYERLYKDCKYSWNVRQKNFDKGNYEYWDSRKPSWKIFSHELYQAIQNFYGSNSIASTIVFLVNERFGYANINDSKNWRIVSLDHEASAGRIAMLIKAIEKGSQDDFYNRVIDIVRNDKDIINLDMFYELLGTKYLREQNYAKAKEALSKVSLTYMSSLSIAPFLGKRRMPAKDFFRVQRKPYYDEDHYNLTRNVKLEYAEKMLALTRKYESAVGEEKAQAAYDIAKNLYQACPAGDLWALTEYRWSSCTLTNDLNQGIVNLLNYVVKNTNNSNLKTKAYFGLATVPTDDDHGLYWDLSAYAWSFDDLTSTQKDAYKHLLTLVSTNDNLYRSCDALRSYIRKNRRTTSSSGTRTSGTRTSAYGTRTSASGTRTSASGTRTSASGTRTSTSRTRTSASGSRTRTSR